MVRTLSLKAAATALTLVATAASALYVGGHLRNASAPLQPAVPGGARAAGGDPSAAGDHLTLTPRVSSGDGVTPVTSTYAS